MNSLVLDVNMKHRLSNIEVLRLLAMLYVLIVHADFSTFGAPQVGDETSHPVGVISQYVFESLTICCVDVFVLISGWFGIRFTLRKLRAFLFQVVFFSLGLFILASLVVPHKAISLAGFKSVFLFNGSDYWFIKAYLLLMILAPVINAFCEHASRREFRATLIAYLAFMLIYGWMEPASIFFTMNGCTALSFIGFYLIGRYMKLYQPKFTRFTRKTDGLIYLALCSFICLVSLALLRFGIRITLDSRLLNYGCPVVVLSAVYLLLFFSKWHFHSNVVNKMSQSCLAVYLLHCNIFLFPLYKDLVRKANQMGGALMIAFLILCVFFIAIGVDRIRILLWNQLDKRYVGDK